MNRRGLLGILLAGSLGAWAQESGGEVQVGQLRFRIPEGWRRQDQSGHVGLVPRDVPPGKTVVMLLLPPQAVPGTLRGWLEGQWEGLKKTWSVEAGGQLNVQKAREGYQVASLGARVASKENPAARFTILMMGFETSPGAVGPFQFITNAEELFPVHQKAVERFLASMSVVPLRDPGAAAAPPKARIPEKDLLSPSFTWGRIEPPPGSGPLDGLYMAVLEVRTFHPSTFRTTVEWTNFYYAFFPDGRFYAALPEEGLENFNFAYWQKKNPEWCGTYTLKGDVGELVYGVEPRFTRSLRRLEGGLAIDNKGPYTRLDRLGGLRLEGTYRRKDWETLGGEAEKKSFIRFTRDGRFEDRGTLQLAGAIWWRGEAGDLVDEGLPGKGAYEIGNNSLSLLYQDGRKRRINIHLPKDVKPDLPESFTINTWTFVRLP